MHFPSKTFVWLYIIYMYISHCYEISKFHIEILLSPLPLTIINSKKIFLGEDKPVAWDGTAWSKRQSLHGEFVLFVFPSIESLLTFDFRWKESIFTINRPWNLDFFVCKDNLFNVKFAFNNIVPADKDNIHCEFFLSALFEKTKSTMFFLLHIRYKLPFFFVIKATY